MTSARTSSCSLPESVASLGHGIASLTRRTASRSIVSHTVRQESIGEARQICQLGRRSASPGALAFTRTPSRRQSTRTMPRLRERRCWRALIISNGRPPLRRGPSSRLPLGLTSAQDRTRCPERPELSICNACRRAGRSVPIPVTGGWQAEERQRAYWPPSWCRRRVKAPKGTRVLGLEAAPAPRDTQDKPAAGGCDVSGGAHRSPPPPGYGRGSSGRQGGFGHAGGLPAWPKAG